jgi:hypothetical protein
VTPVTAGSGPNPVKIELRSMGMMPENACSLGISTIVSTVVANEAIVYLHFLKERRLGHTADEQHTYYKDCSNTNNKRHSHLQ